jgi:SRSO17 transposase
VTVSAWDEDELFRRVAMKIEAELPGIEAFVVDDTGFPKKGTHSVGVARQYSGTLGRTDNCQVAVSLHLAGEQGSSCIGMRLYLPEVWTDDRERCAKAGVPEEVKFKKKWCIALDRIDAALGWGVSHHLVLADAGYGDATEFRCGLTERGLLYAVGITGTQVVWPPGTEFAEPTPRVGSAGRPSKRLRASKEPVVSKAFASSLRYRKVTWREGTRGPMSSRFAAARIRTAHKHKQGHPPGPEEWLLCEWPEKESSPTKFYLSSLPKQTSLKRLVRSVKLRWRIERDYQDLKGEVGLDHFEGRLWRGFHHHAALCSAAHTFLALHRALSPPVQTALDAAARTA